jgi:signal transduction histidine kinase
VENALKQRNHVAPFAEPRPHQTTLGDRIAAVAMLGANAVPGGRCAIAWSSAGPERVVLAPSTDSRWDEVVFAVLAALDNRLSDDAASDANQSRDSSSVDTAASIQKVALSPREMNAIVQGGKLQDAANIREASIQVAASAFSGGPIRDSTVRVVLVADRQDAESRSLAELEALLELMARSVLTEIALGNASALVDFWRAHGAERGRDAGMAKRDLSRERGAARSLESASVAMRKSPPAERLARFGELVAAHAGFDQWIVAIAREDRLENRFEVAAAHPSLTVSDLQRARSPLEESFTRRTVVGRAAFADTVGNPNPLSFVCIPFDAGAIALAARGGGDSVARANAEAIVARLGPIVTNWVMEQQASSRSGLVRQLALRMFTAIDKERARIARDLHDDQAQLLAAAKIALEGGREEARGIFKQIEDELRRKTRELRPATLGRATLDEAIEREFRRLAGAGICATLVHAGTIHENEISRPVQQLCFQVVREALSNAIRHARAKSVEVRLERTGAAARISVSDDGRGIESPSDSEGTGLSGVRERLELMGGSLTIQSQAGRTTIMAEIPELS